MITVQVRTTLDKKYFLPGHTMIDPYTGDANGALYLVADNEWGMHSVLIDAIVSIDIVEVTA